MADETPQVNAKLFWSRIEALHSSFVSDDPLWGGAASLAFPFGKSNTEHLYQKTVVLQTWLTELEFPSALLILTKTAVVFAASEKKLAVLKPLGEAAEKPVKIEFVSYPMSKASGVPWDDLKPHLLGSDGNGPIGVLPKDINAAAGWFADAWKAWQSSENSSTVDITTGLASIYAVKDADMLTALTTAAHTSVAIWLGYLLPKFELVMADSKTITHSKLAEATETIIASPPTTINLPAGVNDVGTLESCFMPIIQSGKNYDLRPSAISDDEALVYKTGSAIVASLGVRYNGLCSNLARTLFVDPSADQEKVYSFALSLRDTLVASLVPGAKTNEIYAKIKARVQTEHPNLVPCLSKSLGFGIGYEFKESYLNITEKNSRTIPVNSAFVASIGFNNIPVPGSTPYAVYIADTVVVKTAGAPDVLTANAGLTIDKDIAFFFNAEEPAPKATTPKKVKTEPPAARSIRLKESAESAIAARDRDAMKAKMDRAKVTEERRRAHQQELAQRKQEEAAQRFTSERMREFRENPVVARDKIEAYQDPTSLPGDAIQGKIFVDVANESVLVPLSGMMVPFHISTIRAAHKDDEGDFHYLRLQFLAPGSTSGNPVPGSPLAGTPFLREVSFRSSDGVNINNCVRLIKELRKRITQRTKEREDQESLIEQEALQVMRGKPPPRLMDVNMRPLLSGKKSQGTVEAHINGLRFTSLRGERVDVMYKNIKHAIFQPAENELITVIHFHLRHDIMLNKKKTKEIQFFTEVMEISQNLDNQRRSTYDADEIEDEQREREMRNRLNKEFQSFVTKVEDVTRDAPGFRGEGIEFDIPYRELGFYGVPFRTNVFVLPTVNCLVSLIDSPFFVMTLSEIEIANFERVQYGLRNFDLVFVFKDYTKPVKAINSIPIEHLDTLKEWLDSIDIKYYESPSNLNWSRVMKTINADPEAFFADGGWNFLAPEAEDEAEEDESESGSEFEGASAGESEEDSDEFDSGSGSDSYDSGSGSASEDELSDEGLDWDELEQEAIKEDRKKSFRDLEGISKNSKKRRTGEYSDEEEEAPRHKKPKTRR